MPWQAQTKVIPQSRFRRAPSRCQMFWQGILILATLALAIAANAQTACFDLFAGRNAPLRKGNFVTIRYSLESAKPNMFSNEGLRRDVMAATTQDVARLKIEANDLRKKLTNLGSQKDGKKKTIAKSELTGQIRKNETQQRQAEQIYALAKNGGRLNPAEFQLLSAYQFQETIVLATKADARRLTDRLDTLNDYLATIEKIEKPPGKIKRVLTFMGRHKIMTVVLMSAAMAAGQVGYNLYLSQQQDKAQGVVTQIYDEGTGNAPLASDNTPKAAIGNDN